MSYWFVCACLLVFGFLAGFSIGLPFFHVGLAMLLLGRFRAHRFVFWPLLLAVIGYEVGFIAVAPFSCSATQQIGEPSTTVCLSLIGLRYEGVGTYNPSLVPGMVTGVAIAALTAIATWLILRSKPSTPLG
jgi:hypothetical protein